MKSYIRLFSFFGILISTSLISWFSLLGQPTFVQSDRLLRQVVDASGSVNYHYLKNQPSLLNAAIDELKKLQPADHWKSEDRLAYWINVYNIFTINLIVQNYPLKSIQELDGGKPWEVKRIMLHEKVYSLNEIEHDIIRRKFSDPRIHFALNCAARSCPPLLNRAFEGSRLNVQLDQRTKAFLQDSQYTYIRSNTIYISKIFEWYKDDFGSILNFINKYRSSPVKSGTRISYLDYDWSLNDL